MNSSKDRITSVLRLFVMGGFIVSILAILSCVSAEQKKADHFKRGLEYAGRDKLDEAMIEFQNVIRLDPDHAEAKAQLAMIYIKKGGMANLNNAFRILNEAVQINPELMDAQLKLGDFYLLSNDLKAANEKADLVLEKTPQNIEAHLIKARVYTKKGRADAAEAAYKTVLSIEPNRVPVYQEFAAFYLREKNADAAEALLKKALSVEVRSVPAHVALAQFYQAMHRMDAAEDYYRRALSLAPKEKGVYFSLANFYLAARRPEAALDTLVQLSRIRPDDPDSYLALGDYHFRQGAPKEAEAAFIKARDLELGGHIGRKRLVRLYLEQGESESGRLEIEKILQDAPSDPDALYLKGRLFLSERRGTEAVALFRQVRQDNPFYPGLQYNLGLAFLLEGDVQQAKAALSEALAQGSEGHRAGLALAGLHNKSGAHDLALGAVEQVIQADPSNLEAHIVRGDTAMALGDGAQAEASYQHALALAPDHPMPYFRLGLLRRAERQDEAARTLFEKALTLNPRAVETLSQIISMLLSKEDVLGAIKRVSTQIAAQPREAGFYQLRGGLYALEKKSEAAEADFKKALDLAPDDLTAYLDLGQFYGREKKYTQALRELDAALVVNPKIVQVYMLRGVIYDLQADYGRARAEYEKALEIDPGFGPAANNLAWIYAEHGGNIDKALDLARLAKEKYPNHPAVSDTLGWIFYKKNAFLKAVSLLKESAEALPDNPVVRYHLGMAYSKEGSRDLAAKELKAALDLNDGFPGAEVARKTLESL